MKRIKQTLVLTAVCLFGLTALHCPLLAGADTVSEDAYNSALAAGVLAAASTPQPLEIAGFWDDGFYNGGTYTGSSGSGRLVVAANADGTGLWGTTQTIEGYSRCLSNGTADGDGTAGVGNDTFYRIIEWNNSTNTLYAQKSLSCDNNWSFGDQRSTYVKFVWTDVATTGCENGATACFNYCQVVGSAATLDAAKASTTTTSSTDVKNSGCNGFAWSHATKNATLSTWN